MKRTVLILAALAALLVAASAKPVKIAVFVPGVTAGNAIYQGLADGVKKAASATKNAEVKVYEAGFNQSEWEDKLTSLVASGSYDFVITSNPSMPDLCAKVGANFPGQKFICLDGYLRGNPNIYTVLYNQTEQGYVTGYLAGLITTSTKSVLAGANSEKKVGFLIAQHYPVMDKIIGPGFAAGLRAVDAAITVDQRVLGNFYDASKAADLAKSMYGAGADVILPIAGGANEGVYKTAESLGRYVVVFDGNDFARAPKNILGCTVLHQDRLACEKTMAAIAGTLKFGTADIVGMKDGYIEFLENDPAYLASVPRALRSRMQKVVADIKSGKLVLTVTTP